ncbi:hypothetical protein TrVE_jg3582 [Triparma verrucosa]|uniref:Uncharacterized protein n=1 Tax=Triparma verrucosa TaxID=1606542 RepID=A0A9W7CCK6_9STRA|nr:hypothetical protein TrVE_jg3582 [Triparma verrucosa]
MATTIVEPPTTTPTKKAPFCSQTITILDATIVLVLAFDVMFFANLYDYHITHSDRSAMTLITVRSLARTTTAMFFRKTLQSFSFMFYLVRRRSC